VPAVPRAAINATRPPGTRCRADDAIVVAEAAKALTRRDAGSRAAGEVRVVRTADQAWGAGSQIPRAAAAAILGAGKDLRANARPGQSYTRENGASGSTSQPDQRTPPRLLADKTPRPIVKSVLVHPFLLSESRCVPHVSGQAQAPVLPQ
jgi:hypothetical protein